MSKELRAELERLQSEISVVRQAIRVAAARIPEARAHAKSAEAALAVIKAPLELLIYENSVLRRQLKWENAHALWGLAFQLGAPLLVLGAAGHL